MAWKVEIDRAALRDLGKLDRQTARRVLTFLYGRVAALDDPRSIGEALRTVTGITLPRAKSPKPWKTDCALMQMATLYRSLSLIPSPLECVVQIVCLPVEEGCEGQIRTTEVTIEPDAQVQGCQLGGDAALQAPQAAGARKVQTKDLLQVPVDRLDDLPPAWARRPAPPPTLG